MNPVTVVVIFIATVGSLAKLCPEGQYYSKFAYDCVGCGENPELTCKNEEEPKACEDSCVKGPNVTESTPRVPETTPEQEGGSQGPQGAPDSIEEKGVTGNKQNDITVVGPSPPKSSGGTNGTIIIVGIICAAIALAIVILVAVYFLVRKYRDQSHPPNPTEHEEMQMVGRNEDNRQYDGSATPSDLDKGDHGSQISPV